MSATGRARENVLEKAAITWKLAAYFRSIPNWQQYAQVATNLDAIAQELARSVGSDYVETDMMWNVTGNEPTMDDLLRLASL